MDHDQPSPDQFPPDHHTQSQSPTHTDDPQMAAMVANGSASNMPGPLGGINKRYRPAPAKTFQCRGYGECRMVFSRSEHLARHIRKHTGERPFSCHCSKQFSRLDNLRQHAQTVHADKQDQNERMMRDLTSLHATMAAQNKVGAGRGARRAPPVSTLLHLHNSANGGENGHGVSPTHHQQHEDATMMIKQEDMGPLPMHQRPGTSTGYEGDMLYSSWQEERRAASNNNNNNNHSNNNHSFRDPGQSFLAPSASSTSPASSTAAAAAAAQSHSFRGYSSGSNSNSTNNRPGSSSSGSRPPTASSLAPTRSMPMGMGMPIRDRSHPSLQLSPLPSPQHHPPQHPPHPPHHLISTHSHITSLSPPITTPTPGGSPYFPFPGHLSSDGRPPPRAPAPHPPRSSPPAHALFPPLDWADMDIGQNYPSYTQGLDAPEAGSSTHSTSPHSQDGGEMARESPRPPLAATTPPRFSSTPLGSTGPHPHPPHPQQQLPHHIQQQGQQPPRHPHSTRASERMGDPTGRSSSMMPPPHPYAEGGSPHSATATTTPPYSQGSATPPQAQVQGTAAGATTTGASPARHPAASPSWSSATTTTPLPPSMHGQRRREGRGSMSPPDLEHFYYRQQGMGMGMGPAAGAMGETRGAMGMEADDRQAPAPGQGPAHSHARARRPGSSRPRLASTSSTPPMGLDMEGMGMEGDPRAPRRSLACTPTSSASSGMDSSSMGSMGMDREMGMDSSMGSMEQHLRYSEELRRQQAEQLELEMQQARHQQQQQHIQQVQQQEMEEEYMQQVQQQQMAAYQQQLAMQREMALHHPQQAQMYYPQHHQQQVQQHSQHHPYPTHIHHAQQHPQHPPHPPRPLPLQRPRRAAHPLRSVPSSADSSPVHPHFPAMEMAGGEGIGIGTEPLRSPLPPPPSPHVLAHQPHPLSYEQGQYMMQQQQQAQAQYMEEMGMQQQQQQQQQVEFEHAHAHAHAREMEMEMQAHQMEEMQREMQQQQQFEEMVKFEAQGQQALLTPPLPMPLIME